MSEAADLSHRPRRSPQVAWRLVAGEVVMVLPSTGKVHTLNRVGSRVWELADGTRDLAAIAQLLGAEFEVTDEQAAADCRAFMNELIDRQLVETA
jgi:hypothetical protein